MSDNQTEVSEGERTEETNALVSRLRVIEDQPLESRAVAFAQIHEQLQSRLDGDAGSGGA